MIEVRNLLKRYLGKTAVDDISFTVEKGEILGLLGPNGAGKSTIMNIITGYISSSKGMVSIEGDDILQSPLKARSKIGYLPEQPPLYKDMTVKAYLGFVFDLKNIKLNKKEHIEEICKITQISDVYNRIIKRLSKGYKQRIGLAQALLGFPPVIILDEPSVGLDPRQIIEMRSLIKKLGENHTVILSSHILSEVKAVCSRVLVINKGKIIADGDPDVLSAGMSDKNSNHAVIEGDSNKVISAIKNIDGVIDVTCTDEVEENVYNYIIDFKPDKDIRRDVFKTLSENDCALMEMKPLESSLEDIFVKLTSEDPQQEVLNAQSTTDAVLKEEDDIKLSEMREQTASKEEQSEQDGTQSSDSLDTDADIQEGGDSNDSNN